MFYSYLWLRNDGTPYYAGKGFGKRAYRSNGHCIRRPKENWRILVYPHQSEEYAFEHEKFLIAIFGRKDLETGCLRNMTDGGDGPSGWVASTETRQKMSALKIGKKLSEEHRCKLSASHKGKKFSPEHAAKLAIHLHRARRMRKGIPHTPEHSRRISEALMGHTISEETRRKISESLKGRKNGN